MRLWAALVSCLGLDGRLRYSLLTVEARNRHAALLALPGVLVTNPDLCGHSGELLPYTVAALRQCRPSELPTLQASFLGLLHEGWTL